MASPTDHVTDRDELQARIAAEDRAIKLDEVWSAWAADDLAQRRRAAAKDEAEARHIKQRHREELLDLRKKRHWGGPTARRWRLHLDGVPTSLANGTYGVIGTDSASVSEVFRTSTLGRWRRRDATPPRRRRRGCERVYGSRE